jgi:hypothetical protein
MMPECGMMTFAPHAHRGSSLSVCRKKKIGADIVVGQLLSHAHLAIGDSALEDTGLVEACLPFDFLDFCQVFQRENGADAASTDLRQHGVLEGTLTRGTVS